MKNVLKFSLTVLLRPVAWAGLFYAIFMAFAGHLVSSLGAWGWGTPTLALLIKLGVSFAVLFYLMATPLVVICCLVDWYRRGQPQEYPIKKTDPGPLDPGPGISPER